MAGYGKAVYTFRKYVNHRSRYLLLTGIQPILDMVSRHGPYFGRSGGCMLLRRVFVYRAGQCFQQAVRLHLFHQTKGVLNLMCPGMPPHDTASFMLKLNKYPILCQVPKALYNYDKNSKHSY
jgi:hypothetical protein